MRSRAACAFVVTLAAVLAVAPGRARAQSRVAITNATIQIDPATTLDKATIVIDGGTIKAVGADVAVPKDAQVIDGTGKIVTAGFIESLSSVGLVGIELEAASVDGRFGALDPVHGDPIHASFQARDAFAPRDPGIAIARSGGITTVIAAPHGGLVGGQSAAFSLGGGGDPVRAPAAMHAELGSGGGGAAGGSRGKAIAMLRELLDDARAYGRDKGAYERNAKRRMIADRLDLEALQPVLRGQLPLVIEAHAEADIRAALRLATEQKLRIAIAGGSEAWRVADELARNKVTVILDPVENLPGRLAASDVHDDAVAILSQAGVPVAISTLGGAWNARTLRQLAGNAIAHGMSTRAAFEAVTTVPAALYGLPRRGTLAAGNIADLVVWSGDPFETTTTAEVVIVGGIVQPTVSRQTRLLERYRKLPLAR
jgi:imidazolonepropionase-like amidohydrolase